MGGEIKKLNRDSLLHYFLELTTKQYRRHLSPYISWGVDRPFEYMVFYEDENFFSFYEYKEKLWEKEISLKEKKEQEYEQI